MYVGIHMNISVVNVFYNRSKFVSFFLFVLIKLARNVFFMFLSEHLFLIGINHLKIFPDFIFLVIFPSSEEFWAGRGLRWSVPWKSVLLAGGGRQVGRTQRQAGLSSHCGPQGPGLGQERHRVTLVLREGSGCGSSSTKGLCLIKAKLSILDRITGPLLSKMRQIIICWGRRLA